MLCALKFPAKIANPLTYAGSSALSTPARLRFRVTRQGVNHLLALSSNLALPSKIIGSGMSIRLYRRLPPVIREGASAAPLIRPPRALPCLQRLLQVRHALFQRDVPASEDIHRRIAMLRPGVDGEVALLDDDDTGDAVRETDEK
jgi:hypothetical protein